MDTYEVVGSDGRLSRVEADRCLVDSNGHLTLSASSELVARFAPGWVSCIRRTPEKPSGEHTFTLNGDALVATLKKHDRDRGATGSPGSVISPPSFVRAVDRMGY